MEDVRTYGERGTQRFSRFRRRLQPNYVSWLIGAWLAIFSPYFGGTGWAVDRGSINSGETRSSSISVSGQKDTWTFQGAAGDRIRAVMVATTGTLTPYLCLYPPGYTNSTPAETCAYTGIEDKLQQTGLYTIIVLDNINTRTGDYNLTFLKMPGSLSFPGDPDGRAIASGETLSGKINVPSDFDAFQFFGTAGDRIRAIAVTTSGSLIPYLCLYPPDHSAALRCDYTGIDIQLPQTGLYTVMVQDNTLARTGDYNLTFTKTPPGPDCGLYNPSPVDTAALLSSSSCSILSWTLAHCSVAATGYDVYFGEELTTPLAKIGDNIPSPSLACPSVQVGKVYRWRVVAHTSNGDIKGPTWWFDILKSDLVETAVSNPPANAAPGSQFPVTDTVKNIGRGTAGASTTRYYLSLDTTKSSGDKLLTGSRAVPSLAPGQTSTGTVTVTVPTSTATGDYYLLACADDTFVVTESNGGNNCKPSSTKVHIGSLPDLVETAVSDPPANAVVGSQFAVTDTAKNNGPGTAGPSTTRYYLSLNTVKDSGDVLLGGSRAVPSLIAGQTSTGTVTVTVPTSTATGDYYLLACADDTFVVTESNGGNNCLASHTKVAVGP